MDYQDVLAEVGAGSAHPGGMQSTRIWMKSLNIGPMSRVLEVGCGTGRTLLELERKFGCSVTGVDIRSVMVEKARRRAKEMGQTARFIKANVEALPFPDGEFDLIVSESVHVFCDPDVSLSECRRVLCAGGQMVDVEMVVLEPVTEAWRRDVQNTYGVRQVPDLAGWKQLYSGAGFHNVQTLTMRRVVPDQAMVAEQQDPDPIDLSSKGAYQKTQVLSTLEANAKWLERNHHSMGYAIFLLEA